MAGKIFNNMKKTINIWFGVNKNGFVCMHTVEPTRNEKTGKWESKYPFVNSIIYGEICKLVEKSKLNWNSEIESITLQMS